MKAAALVTRDSISIGAILSVKTFSTAIVSRAMANDIHQIYKTDQTIKDDFSTEYIVKTIYKKKSAGVKLITFNDPKQIIVVKWPDLFSKYQFSFGPNARDMIKEEKKVKGYLSIIHKENANAIGHAIANNVINPSGTVKLIVNNDDRFERNTNNALDAVTKRYLNTDDGSYDNYENQIDVLGLTNE